MQIFYIINPKINASTTIIGAGIFLVNNNPTVINMTNTFSKLKPVLSIKTIAAVVINPPATAVIPANDILIPLIFFKFSHIG